jgi:hypothetical protein
VAVLLLGHSQPQKRTGDQDTETVVELVAVEVGGRRDVGELGPVLRQNCIVNRGEEADPCESAAMICQAQVMPLAAPKEDVSMEMAATDGDERVSL